MQNIKAIKAAQLEAQHVIAESASEAKKVIADATAEAMRVTSVAAGVNSADHDLLVKLATQMDGLKVDIRDFRNDNTVKNTANEIRINELERWNIRQIVCLSVGAIWLSALTIMLIWHLFKVPLS